MSDQDEVFVTGEVQGKNPRRIAAGKKAANQMGHEKLSQIGKKGAKSRVTGSSSASASDEESGELGEFENELVKNPQRVAAGGKEGGVRRSGRTSRTGSSSDEGGRDSSEEGRGKDPKRVAAAKKAAETRKRKAQEAKEKASAEGGTIEPENKKPATSKMEGQVPVMEGEMYDERKDPEFNPASEREFIETEEPSRNPKQEEEEATREIQEQSRQMGIDPSKATHETRTGLDYPTSQDRVTKHKEEYIEKGEEDIPSVESGFGKNPEQVAKGRKAAAGTTHEEFVERGKKGAEARWGKQQGSLARNQ